MTKGLCAILLGLATFQVQAETSTGCTTDSQGQTLRQLSAGVAGAAPSEGKIVLCFDVDTKGKVQNIRVIEDNSAGAFDREILAALNKWRFESDKPLKDYRVTIGFKPENNARGNEHEYLDTVPKVSQ